MELGESEWKEKWGGGPPFTKQGVAGENTVYVWLNKKW